MKEFIVDTGLSVYKGYLLHKEDNNNLYIVAPVSCIRKRNGRDCYSKIRYATNEAWVIRHEEEFKITIDGVEIQ